jgi:hypothetical protein
MAADYGIANLPETILRASNLESTDYFGSSVAISGDYAIVGAWGEDGSSNQFISSSGAAYIFERNTTTGVWSQKTILRASNLAIADQFGGSVAISGNYAIVGAYLEDGSSTSTTFECGAAYIFERSDSTPTGVWSQKTILRASNLGFGYRFGISVAISGDYAIVGAHQEDGSSTSADFNSGAAYIFERDGSGNWAEKTILRASNFGATDFFGYSVSISGNYAIVSAYQEDGSNTSGDFNSGSVYIFERDGSGNWTEKTMLTASNADGGDSFGISVSISDNYAIVGAYFESGPSNTTFRSGAAYIFERDGSGNWTEKTILRASNLEGSDYFGVSVAISGNYAIIAATFEDGTNTSTSIQSGAAYLFERNITTGVWSEKTIIRASNRGPNDQFGYDVAISGDYVIVGAINEDGVTDVLSESGAAYIYTGFTNMAFIPTPLTFVNNTLTIANSINSTDTDVVSFSLTAGTTLTSLNVSNFTGTGTVTYILDISGGANVVTGTVNATNANLLTGGALTASVNTTYRLTLTANASITYSIFGLLVTCEFTYTKLGTSGFTPSQITAAGYNIANLKANGITDAQLLGAGYTIAIYADQGVLPNWNFDASASHIIKSYVKDFVDISGSVVLRNNANLYVHGNAQLGGNLSLNRPAINADLSFNNRIFVGGDVSMNGKVNIGGNVSLIGSVVNCSNVANDSVPQNAFNGSVSSGPDYTAARVAYRQNFQVNDDVSMNGTTVQANNVKANGNIVFSDGTIMNSYDNNIFSTNPTVFKPSTFTSLAINGNLTAGSYSTSSDYRIKTEVAQLDETVTVDNLRPVKYVQTLINKTQYGLIAHELQEYYPDLVVGEKDGDGWQRVNYTGLIAILINEIKRMKQDLAELEGEI